MRPPLGSILAIVALACLLPALARQDDAPPPAQTPPATDAAETDDPRELVDSGLTYHVDVRLAEFKILVTDKRGRPITDLRPDEIEVYEAGERQRLAFLETVSGGRAIPTEREQAPPPAVVFDSTEKDEFAPEPGAVQPTKPRRRIVFAFDVRNSKMNIRERWQESALDWLNTQKQPDDLVGIVVFRTFPDWIVPFTDNVKLLESTLSRISLIGGTPDRDRRRDMDRLVEAMHANCKDPGRIRSSRRQRTETQFKNSDSSFDEISCSYHVANDYVVQWTIDGEESVETMRALTGQLAATPGRKMVLLFSEGIVADPSTIAVNAMIAVNGVRKIDISRAVWRFNKNLYDELNALHHAARAADVAFFTFDTTRGADSGVMGSLEIGEKMQYETMGINPWSEMQTETRQTLNALAKETGGRSFHNAKRLETDLKSAADSFFGQYSVGYYREDPDSRPGRVTVKIRRKGMKVDYTDRISLSRHTAREVPMDVTVATPRLSGEGNTQIVPIALTLEADAIPLRRGGGGRGVQLGAHVQAIRPDGSIAAEKLEIVTVFVEREQAREAKGKTYLHQTTLTLPPGSYRIRTRISDDRQKILSDRAVDVTVELGDVRPGIEDAAAIPVGAPADS